jgi:hypothetical protein
MAIRAPEPPDEALEAVRESVARRAPSGGATRVRRMFGRGPAEPTVSAPQRVFTVGLDSLAGGRAIEEAAEPTGWRFLVEEGEEPVAAAEVQDQTGAAVPAQVSEGAFVRSTAEGLRAAEELPPVQETGFELRLLRVPAIYLNSLWLHAPDRPDLFVPLDPAPPGLEAGASYEEPRFAEIAAGLAREALEAHQAADRPGELGA